MSNVDAELPKVGERVRVWYGSGFIREGRARSVNEQDRMVYVEFDYDLPDEWVRENQLC